MNWGNRTRKARIFLYAATLAIAGGALAGCGRHVDKIGDLNGNPDEYMHRTVTIVGHVTQVYSLPLGLTDLAVYQVGDGTGRIWVVSHDGAPGDDDRIGVKGRLEPVGSLHLGVLGNPFGNVIEEQQRHTD